MARRPRPASSLRTIASKPVAPEGRPSRGAHRHRSVRPVKVRPARNLRSERRRIAYHVPFFEESPAWLQVDITLPPISLPERPASALAMRVHPHAGDIPGSDSVHTGPKNSLRRMKSEPGIAERPSAARIGIRTERAQDLHRRAHRAPSGTDARFVTTRISTRIGTRTVQVRDLGPYMRQCTPSDRTAPYPHAPTRRAGIVANTLAAHSVEPEHAIETWIIRAAGVQGNLIVNRPGRAPDGRVGL